VHDSTLIAWDQSGRSGIPNPDDPQRGPRSPHRAGEDTRITSKRGREAKRARIVDPSRSRPHGSADNRVRI
jgi:hypothetical protein